MKLIASSVRKLPLFCLFFFYSAILTAQTSPIISEGFPILLETDRSSRFSTLEGPIPADLDGDGLLEVVVASGKNVYVYRYDGKPMSGWPKRTTYTVTNSPAIGDLDNNGNLEIVVFDRNGNERKSFLYVWNYHGELLSGFPINLALGTFAMALHDLNGDNKLEIIGGFGGKLYVFNHDGTMAPGWPKDLAPNNLSSKAALGDINDDGLPEIVVTASLPVFQDLEKTSQGSLYALKANGEMFPGWPVTTPLGYTYVGWCNPALADVNEDGFLEIAVGTYSFVPPNNSAYVVLYRYDGTVMPGWPQFTAGLDSLNSIASGPAIADLDDDGKPDLIFGDQWDHVVAWKGDGSLVSGWPVIYGALDSSLFFRSTAIANPSCGDFDGDGQLEVFVNNNQADLLEGVWRGRIYAFNHDASSLPWSPLRPRQFASSNTVAMADLDRDGSLDLITVSSDVYDNETWLTVWEVPGVPYVEERFPWPMYGHDRWHTSQYGFKPPDEPTVGVKEREERNQLPKDFVLHQNYPNPFYAAASSLRGLQNQTEISYELPVSSHVELRVFNLLGAEVRRLVAATQAAGKHRAFWEGRDESGHILPAGIYFYRMEATPQNRGVAGFRSTKKLTKLN